MPAELPSPAQRTWHLEQLAELVHSYGLSRLVQGPWFFPDRPVRDAADLRQVAARMFLHAGLDVAVEVVSYDLRPDLVDTLVATRRGGAPVWMDALEGRTCRIGVESRRLGEGLLPALTAEVVKAWRVAAGHQQPDLQLEALSVVPTATYLGLGHLLEPGPATGWSVALALSVRNPDEKARKRALARLGERPDVAAALTELARLPTGGLSVLIGDEAHTPTQPGGKPVQVKEATRAAVLCGAGAGLGAVAAWLAQEWALLPLVAALGTLVGMGMKRQVCSGCGHALTPRDALCPGCSGLVVRER